MANLNKPFEPYYDRVLGQTITSQRQKERLVKSHKSKSHPQGIYDVRDDHKFMKEQKYIQEHREEFKATTREGYKPMTQRELERHGERKHDPSHPTDSARRTYFFQR